MCPEVTDLLFDNNHSYDKKICRIVLSKHSNHSVVFIFIRGYDLFYCMEKIYNLIMDFIAKNNVDLLNSSVYINSINEYCRDSVVYKWFLPTRNLLAKIDINHLPKTLKELRKQYLKEVLI